MLRKKPVRIPTLAAFSAIVFFMLTGVFLSNNFTLPWSKAASFDLYPEDVRISNLSDSSFVISWITEKPVTGFVKINDKKIFDSRDNNSPLGIYKVHYVEVKNLEIKEEIAYTIVSAGIDFPQEKIIILPEKIVNPIQILPLNGEIQTASGKAASGAIIYFSMDKASLWSLFIYGKTNWLMPLSSIRNADLADYFCKTNDCNDDFKAKMEIFSEEGNSLVLATLGNLRPQKEIVILGENADLTISESAEITPAFEAIDDKQNIKGLSTAISVKKANTQTVEILNPKENAALPYVKPFIRGFGIPNEEVIITLESKAKQVGKTKVRDDGTWYFTPFNSLDAGKHILTITTKDKNGKTITLNRQFYILKSGESVLSEATAEATIAPTIAPSVPPTSAPFYPSITPYPTIPKSGSASMSLSLAAGGILFLFFGLTMLLI